MPEINEIYNTLFPCENGFFYMFTQGKTLKGGINELHEAIADQINKAPVYIFPGLIKTIDKNNSAENIAALKTVYIDIDNEKDSIPRDQTMEKINEMKFKPTIIVESGRGTHLYWVLDKSATTKEDIQKVYLLARVLCEKLDGDKSVYSPGHMLRLIGSINEKVNKRTEVKLYNENRIYSIEEMLVYYAVEINDLSKKPVLNNPHNNSILKKMYNSILNEPKKISLESIESIIAECNFLTHCVNDSETLSLEDWKKEIYFLANQGEHGLHLIRKYSESYPDFNENQMNDLIKFTLSNSLSPCNCKRIRSDTNNKYCIDCKYADKLHNIQDLVGHIGLGYFFRDTMLSPLEENTDTACANGWIEFTDGRYCFNADKNIWMEYNGRFWQEDSLYNGLKYLIMFSNSLEFFANNYISDKDKKKDVLSKSYSLRNMNKVKSTLEMASYLTRKNENSFNSKVNLLNFPNGTLNIDSGYFYPHSQDDYISQMMNFPYDPENHSCPRFTKFLNWAFCEDQELITYFCELIGYILSGSMTQQILPFFYGSGANGKSVVVKMLQDMLNMNLDSKVSYGTMINIDALIDKKHNSESKHEITRLKSKRVAFANETADTKTFNDSLLKQLGSKDLITGRELYKNSIEFVPTSTLIIIGNNKPIIRGSDNGIWRRLKIIPFLNKVSPEEMIPDLEKTFIPEYSGIFNLFLDGYTNFLRNNCKFSITPKKVSEATQDYQEENSSINLFLIEECEFDVSFETNISKLFERYKEWCLSAKEFCLSRSHFKKKLLLVSENLGHSCKEVHLSNQSCIIKGIQIVDLMHRYR